MVFTKTKLITSSLILLLSMLTPLIGLMPQASAVTDVCTWTGTADNTFNDAANWNCSIDGSALPENGDTIQFDVTGLTQTEVISNDMVGLSVAGINRIGTNGSFNFELEGNALMLTGPIVGTSTYESGQLRIRNEIVLGSNVTIDNMNQVYLDPPSTFDIATFDLILDGSSNIWELQGSGNVIVQAPDNENVQIGGVESSFTGSVSVMSGSLLTTGTALSASSGVVVSSTGNLSLSSGDFGVPISIGGDGNNYCWGPSSCSLELNGSTISGGLTLTSDVSVLVSDDSRVTGTYTPSDNTIAISPGSEGALTLPDNTTLTVPENQSEVASGDTSTDAVVIWNGQTVVVNGERGSAYIYYGGTLKGFGTITGTVNVASGGVVAPGESPGCISTGNFNLAGTLEVEIGGTTRCTEYDQTQVAGDVTLIGGTAILSVESFINGFVPALSDEFVIISNDGTDPVVGTFAGLAEGSTITIDGVTLAVSYVGGEGGNDIVLTVTSVPETPPVGGNSESADTPTVPDTGLGSLISNPFVPFLSAMLSLGAVIGVRKLNNVNK